MFHLWYACPLLYSSLFQARAMVQRSANLAAVILGLISLLGLQASGQDPPRSPFLAAEAGSFPKCKVYGRTYCLESPDYPK